MKPPTNPGGFIAVFKDGSVGAANKIVLVLLRERGMRRGGEDGGILFVLGSEPGPCSSVCSFQLAFTFKMETSQRGAGASLPCLSYFLCSLRAEFITKQEQSEALRGSGCSGSDFNGDGIKPFSCNYSFC